MSNDKPKNRETQTLDTSSTALRAMVVLCASPLNEADALALMLIEKRLAACVSQSAPMRSTYRWEGKIEIAPEVQLVIKTSPDRVDALLTTLKALHPYDVPELLVLEAGGDAEYLAWVAGQTELPL